MRFFSTATSGQYLPGASPVHRLDPRAKLAACLLGIVSCFWPGQNWTVAIAWPLLGTGLMSSSVPLRHFSRSLRPFLGLSAISLVLHGLNTPGESVASFPWGPLDLTREGLEQGAVVSAQLATGAALSSLLTLTTSPADLVWALTRLFSPLRRLGLPVGEFFLSLLVALRFLPILQQESDRLVALQRTQHPERGHKFRERLRLTREFASTLFRQTFANAGTLLSADALLQEGSNDGTPRRLGFAEFLALGLGLATVAGAAISGGRP